MFVIRSHFIGSFKTGDNIVDSFKSLRVLYEIYSEADTYQKHCLRKPIVLLIASICEAVLHDLYMKIRAYSSEGVMNVTSEIALSIRGKQIDKFKKYIDVARKHDILCPSTPAFYDALDEVRNLRNRIHLHKHLGRRDWHVFDDESKILTEKVCERLLRRMCSKFPREYNHVNAFEIPWEPHFPNQG